MEAFTPAQNEAVAKIESLMGEHFIAGVFIVATEVNSDSGLEAHFEDIATYRGGHGNAYMRLGLATFNARRHEDTMLGRN